MESRLKLRMSRVLCSSFGSCRSKDQSDVIQHPLSAPQNHHDYQFIHLSSPIPRPFPSICKPKWPQTYEAEHHFIKLKDPKHKPTTPTRKSLLVSADMEGRKCPPASPISPIKPKRKSKKTMRKKTHLKNKKFESDEFNSLGFNYYEFSSSDEDDDEMTIFSSNSLSSDSSGSFCKSGKNQGLKGKVKDSFAIVKRSSDPHSDFRTSMVEMIVERQIFAAKDLENLLDCFLSLNSHHHHRAILEVFSEICETLFPNWA